MDEELGHGEEADGGGPDRRSSPSDEVSDELRKLLSADQTRLGDVYRCLDRGLLDDESIAKELGVATSRLVWNQRRIIKALLEGDLPSAPSVATQAARSFRSFLKGDLSPATRSYLERGLGELDRRSGQVPSREVLQTVYDLFRDRGAWPTFRTLDLYLDRRLGIEDAQAVLAAVPSGYLQRSWNRIGYYDNDEVRLTIRGVSECDGGPEDLERLIQFVRWLSEIEQEQDLDDENDLVVEVVDFAAQVDLPVGTDSSGDQGEEDAADGEVARNRALLSRLQVLAELLPRFWSGFGWQEPWRWRVTLDRRGLRPYRGIQNVGELLRYAEQEGKPAGTESPLLVTGDSNVIHIHYPQAPSDAVQTDQIQGDLELGRLSEGRDEIDVLLTILRPEIAEVANEQFRAGRYDEAIFAAYRSAEATLQNRSHLEKAIGDGLVNQAFKGDKPRIRVSDRDQDAERLAQLFSGAIGLYKGDRSHKDKPALPCRSRRECLRQLANASALLDLLDRDIDTAPVVRGHDYDQRGGTLELWVERAGAQSQVWIDDQRCDIVRHDPGRLILNVAGVKPGEHDLFVADGTRTGQVTQIWLTRNAGATGWRRVVEVNIPLFSEPTGPHRLSATGLRLAVREDGVTSERIVPTTGTYRVGDYVGQDAGTGTPGTGLVAGSASIGPAYISDGSGDARHQLWESAALFDGEPYTAEHGPRLMNVTLEPSTVLLRPKEKGHVRVLGHYTDGVATWDAPLTDCAVDSDDSQVAHVKNGALFANGHGRATLRATKDGLYASAAVHVAAHPAGEVVDMLTGLPSIAGLAWADNGLFVSTRTDQLWKLGTDGKYALAVAIPGSPSAIRGTGTVTAAECGDLAVRLLGRRDVLVLDHASGYGKSRWAAPEESGAVTAVTWHGDDLVVATDSGVICRIRPNGKSERIAVVQGKQITSMCSHDGSLLALTAGDLPELLSISLSAVDGALFAPAPHDQDPLTANVVANLNDEVYLVDSVGGRLLRLADQKVIEVATCLRQPGELAASPDGSVFIAESGRGAVRRVFP